MDAEAEDLIKEIFVKEWLRTGDPFKAGIVAFPGDTGRAMRASWEWPKDIGVLQYRQQLVDESNTIAGLPTKTELALQVYRLGDAAFDNDTKIEAFRLTAQIMGYIEKPSSVVVDNSQMNITNKVMVIADYGSDDNWEASLAKNQKLLTDQSSRKN